MPTRTKTKSRTRKGLGFIWASVFTAMAALWGAVSPGMLPIAVLLALLSVVLFLTGYILRTLTKPKP